MPFQHACSLPSPSEKNKQKNETMGMENRHGYLKQVSLVAVYFKMKI